MAKQKIDTFILRNDFFPQIKLLGREQRGDLLTAIFAYSTDEELPEMDQVTQMCFGFIKASLDANSEKYQARCDKNRENGSRGGRPSRKATGSENNRTVLEESEWFPEEASDKDGFDEKPNAEIENPIKSYSDSYSNLKSDSEYNLISLSAAGAKEKENFLKILLFDKKLLDPQTELDRFCTHYEKSGWVDANGKPVKNRSAALKAWTPVKDAQKCSSGVSDIWREVYEAATSVDPGADCTSLLTLFRGIYTEGQTIHITAANKYLADFLEQPDYLQAIRPVLDKHFGAGKRLNYRVPKR